MTQLGQAAAIASTSIQLSEELRQMHAGIVEHELAVPLHDDFYAQSAALEEHVGGDGFRRTRARARMINILSGVVAAPVLLAVIAGIVLDRLMRVDVFAWLFDNPWTFVIAGALLVAVVVLAILLRVTNRRLLSREYPQLLARAGLR